VEHKISTPYGHILPLFGPSLFIVKWLNVCFKLKNRAFRVIQQYKQSQKLNFLIFFFARLVRDSFVYNVFTWPKYVKKTYTSIVNTFNDLLHPPPPLTKSTPRPTTKVKPWIRHCLWTASFLWPHRSVLFLPMELSVLSIILFVVVNQITNLCLGAGLSVRHLGRPTSVLSPPSFSRVLPQIAVLLFSWFLSGHPLSFYTVYRPWSLPWSLYVLLVVCRWTFVCCI